MDYYNKENFSQIHTSVILKISKQNKINIFNNGSLGSRNDEERGKKRYLI